MEAAGILWTLVGVVVVLLLALFMIGWKLVKVGAELQKLHKTLDGLDKRLGEQERRLAEMQQTANTGSNGIAPLLGAFEAFRSKGWMSAAMVLGTHLFRSYLGKRRQLALPAKKEP